MRMRIKGENTFYVVGWEFVYEVCKNERWFEVSHRTPVEAVFYSDFEDAVNKISRVNFLNR